jgi:putative membrane protein
MLWAARILTVLVAVEHAYFFVLEVFLWRTPFGRRTFGTTPELAESTASIMKNQGTYNLFLAAGLAFSLWRGDPAFVLFFLGCVVVAGIVGAVTVKRSILVVQALPALAAAVAVELTR